MVCWFEDGGLQSVETPEPKFLTNINVQFNLVIYHLTVQNLYTLSNPLF